MSSKTPIITFMQTVLDGGQPNLNRRIPIKIITEAELVSDPDHLSIFDHALPIGISPGFSEQGKIISLALADEHNGLIIEFYANPSRERTGSKRDSRSSSQRDLSGRQLLEEKILCRDVSSLFAFDMGPVSMSLHFDLKLRITNAIDIQSAFSAVDRKPLTAIRAALGDSGIQIKADNVTKIFLYPVYDPEDRKCKTELASRAWLSQFLATDGNGPENFDKVVKVDTKKLSLTTLDMIAKLATDAHRLNHSKPLQAKHQLSGASVNHAGQNQVNAASYKHKFRGESKPVRVQVQGPSGPYTVHATVDALRGPGGILRAPNSHHLNGKTTSITTVESIGRDDPTTAEAHRAATVLRILQGSQELLQDNPWIQNIWFPDDDGSLPWPIEWSNKPIYQPNRADDFSSYDVPLLNSSQQHAVNTMCSLDNAHHLVLIQGPPGTGKTSVISAYVLYALNQGHKGIWLVAQSNVAVKNIAEKLIKVGFYKWKLLVSKEFHSGWHEHLYETIKHNIILSEGFKFIGKKDLQDCKVILCTLSMLSNSHLSKFTTHIPLNALIVDEASQIEVGNYVPIFSSFGSLRKVCFVGDDKQLPPFGQEDLQDLQSIFEITHLKKHVQFLDTQYRMPPQIGGIISNAVYDGKLNSNPQHPITEKVIACYFVDAVGLESQIGKSWKNDVEQSTVLILAQHLQDAGMKYKIITPYEQQTSSIENAMKTTEGLNWEDKCFNVDAFQGNEEDYIILSLVRSQRLGFLSNLRRTNVMLTRCKKGMYIISSRKFLLGPGAECLAGEMFEKMEEKMGPQVWLTMKDVEEGKIVVERKK